jgi:hypothetical protein
MHTIFEHSAVHFGGPKKCGLDGCNICLCENRSDADFCGGKHRCKHHNEKYKEREKTERLVIKIGKENTRVINDLHNREIFKVNARDLLIAGYDFTVPPLEGNIGGKKVALYGDCYMWEDFDKWYNIEKIKK